MPFTLRTMMRHVHVLSDPSRDLKVPDDLVALIRATQRWKDGQGVLLSAADDEDDDGDDNHDPDDDTAPRCRGASGSSLSVGADDVAAESVHEEMILDCTNTSEDQLDDDLLGDTDGEPLDDGSEHGPAIADTAIDDIDTDVV